MKSIFKMELKRAFCNKMFLPVVVLGCAIAAAAFFTTNAWVLTKAWWFDYLPQTQQGQLVAAKSQTMDTALTLWMPNRGAGSPFYYLFITILPILAAIPYGASYLTDKKSGLVNQIAVRAKKRDYYISKLIVTFLNGGTVAVIPLLFNLLMCMCSLPLGKPIYATLFYPVKDFHVLADMYYTNPVLYMIIYFIFTFFVYGLINCLCLTFTYLEENRFAIILTPFILIFCEYVLLNYGLGLGDYALFWCASLFYFKKEAAVSVMCQLAVLLAVAAGYLIRIKKDVL